MKKVEFFEKVYDEIILPLVLMAIIFVKIGNKTWHNLNLLKLLFVVITLCCFFLLRRLIKKFVPKNEDIEKIKAENFLYNVKWIVRTVGMIFIIIYSFFI